MTDRPDADARLEGRLRAYFAGEIDRATRDLAGHPVAVDRASNRLRLSLLIVPVTALLVVAAIWVATTGGRLGGKHRACRVVYECPADSRAFVHLASVARR